MHPDLKRVDRRRMFMAAALLAVVGGVHAQPAAGHRSFPAQALRGILLVQTPPQAVLNGQAARLAPGVRIRGADNLALTTGALAGQPLMVHYTVESATGLIAEVWVLNAVELENRLWPRTAGEASLWTFEPASQTWKRP